MAAPQIPLNEILAAMDRKDRDYYKNLDDELKKKFSPYMMLKFMASIRGNSDYEHYFIQATNFHANKNMFDISSGGIGSDHDHRQLQWLLLTTVSPDGVVRKHNWLKPKPKIKDNTGPIQKQLLELFPNMKEDDVETLSKLITKKELNQYVKDHGD